MPVWMVVLLLIPLLLPPLLLAVLVLDIIGACGAVALQVVGSDEKLPQR